MDSAAELLEGRTLESGWFVNRKITIHKHNSLLTGGNFSVSYEVKKDGKVAFLKALDFSKAFENSRESPATILARIASEFAYEKDILTTCQKYGIRRVVKLLDNGVEEVEGSKSPHKTEYLIFEWAESDVRKIIVYSETFDNFWILKCMHGITSGLFHLHQNQIIHQDIKPSNVLFFQEQGIKIGDFGRAYSANHGEVQYNKENIFPGDRTYAPPEILYGYATGPHERIRRGVDVYMLGSMLYFFFTKVPLTAKIIEILPKQLHHNNGPWERNQILPSLQVYYSEVVEEFKQCVPESIREKVAEVLMQLTDPNPEKRGHPVARRSHENNLSLERYVNIFDLLSTKIAIENRKMRKE